MAGGSAAELSELLDVVKRKVIAGEVERAVEEHRAASGREHETIAPIPTRVARIVPHVAGEEQEAIGAIPIGIPGWPEFAF
jgi:hypothetical protein